AACVPRVPIVPMPVRRAFVRGRKRGGGDAACVPAAVSRPRENPVVIGVGTQPVGGDGRLRIFSQPNHPLLVGAPPAVAPFDFHACLPQQRRRPAQPPRQGPGIGGPVLAPPVAVVRVLLQDRQKLGGGPFPLF